MHFIRKTGALLMGLLALAFAPGLALAQSGTMAHSLPSAQAISSTDAFWCDQDISSIWRTRDCSASQLATYLEQAAGLIAGPASAVVGDVPVLSQTNGMQVSDSGVLLTTLQTSLHGVAYPASPSVSTVPVVTSSSSGGAVTYEQVPNAALANPCVTIGSTALCLGGTGSTIAGVTLTGPILNSPTINTPTATGGSYSGGVYTSLGLAGTGSGVDTFVSSNAGSANHNITFFSANDTVLGRATTDTVINKSIAASEVNSGTLASAQLPAATTGALGAVQVGAGLAVSGGGVISAAVPASSLTTVASPTAPASTSAFTMQGYGAAGATITPSKTGTISVTISGTAVTPSATGAGDGVTYKVQYGTGTAPTSATAITGTTAGLPQTVELATASSAASEFHVPFSITVVITGLTVGTAAWVDLAAEAIQAASSVQLVNVAVAIAEL